MTGLYDNSAEFEFDQTAGLNLSDDNDRVHSGVTSYQYEYVEGESWNLYITPSSRC
jgi:hypothetical protein